MPTDKANRILKLHWNGKLPISPKQIAEAMGVTVQSHFYRSEDSVSGEFKVENGQPLIRYNPAEVPVRQRFTIAHELGHHVLAHGSAFRDTSSAFSSRNYDPKEAQANDFAATLLMPETAIKNQIMDKGNKTLSGLAKVFEVSEVAMRYRLKNLGWLVRG